MFRFVNILLGIRFTGACIDVAPCLEAVGWDGSGGCICLTDWIVDEIVLETGAAAVIVGNA